MSDKKYNPFVRACDAYVIACSGPITFCFDENAGALMAKRTATQLLKDRAFPFGA